MNKDKNGYEIQEGASVRLTQTQADYQMPSRVYEVKEISGELFACIAISELKNEGSDFHAVETLR
jgi:hypothetical protein